MKLTFLVLTALLALYAVLTVFTDANFQCTVCGIAEHRSSRLYIPTDRTQSDTPYSKWFASKVALAHEHDWMLDGCCYEGKLTGVTVSCGRRDLQRVNVLAVLPRLPDQDLAVRAAHWLAQASPEQRFAELLRPVPIEKIGFALGIETDSGWRPPAELVNDARREWLESSPLAREVFAPALR